jgi:hypothetical protein
VKKAALKVFAWCASAGAVLALGLAGQRVPFEEQWPLYEALRTTAAIIFAVIGAWLAIIYPERLRLSFGKTEGAAPKNGGKFSELFAPIVHSSLILCIVLLVGILAPVLKRADFVAEHVTTMRGLSFALLSSLTLWQLWTVVLTLVPADRIKSAADQDASDHRAKSALRGLAQQDGTRPEA